MYCMRVLGEKVWVLLDNVLLMALATQLPSQTDPQTFRVVPRRHWTQNHGRAAVFNVGTNLTLERFKATTAAFRSCASQWNDGTPYALVIDLSGITFNDMKVSYLGDCINIYNTIYGDLEANVHTTVVVLSQTFLRTFVKRVMAAKTKTATEVVFVESTQAAWDTLDTIMTE